jgi:hypothetical protein
LGWIWSLGKNLLFGGIIYCKFKFLFLNFRLYYQ